MPSYFNTVMTTGREPSLLAENMIDACYDEGLVIDKLIELAAAGLTDNYNTNHAWAGVDAHPIAKHIEVMLGQRKVICYY